MSEPDYTDDELHELMGEIYSATTGAHDAAEDQALAVRVPLALDALLCTAAMIIDAVIVPAPVTVEDRRKITEAASKRFRHFVDRMSEERRITGRSALTAMMGGFTVDAVASRMH